MGFLAFFCGLLGGGLRLPCQATCSGTAGVVPGCPLPGFGIHAHLDRGARPLVDEAFLRAEPPFAVCDADFDFERVSCRRCRCRPAAYGVRYRCRAEGGRTARFRDLRGRRRDSRRAFPAGSSRRRRHVPRSMRSRCGCPPCRSSRTSARRCSATSLRSGSKSRL